MTHPRIRKSNPLHQEDLSKIVFEITEVRQRMRERLTTILKFYAPPSAKLLNKEMHSHLEESLLVP